MTLANVFIIAALVATFAALAGGVISMAHGGKYDRQHSALLMISRVGFQALTLALLVMALLVA
jgi:hypothetical protein